MRIADEIRMELDLAEVFLAESHHVDQPLSNETNIAALMAQIAVLSSSLVKVAAVTDRLWEDNQSLLAMLNGR